MIIADEPTTALDVTIQAQILYEMQKLCAQSGTVNRAFAVPYSRGDE